MNVILDMLDKMNDKDFTYDFAVAASVADSANDTIEYIETNLSKEVFKVDIIDNIAVSGEVLALVYPYDDKDVTNVALPFRVSGGPFFYKYITNINSVPNDPSSIVFDSDNSLINTDENYFYAFFDVKIGNDNNVLIDFDMTINTSGYTFGGSNALHVHRVSGFQGLISQSATFFTVYKDGAAIGQGNYSFSFDGGKLYVTVSFPDDSNGNYNVTINNFKAGDCFYINTIDLPINEVTVNC